MSDEPGLIDLDTAPQSTSGSMNYWRRFGSAKISLVAALVLMIAAGGAGAATAAYVARPTDRVRIVSVAADIALDPTPRVESTDGQVRLDGSVTITNVGASPFSVKSIRMDPARVHLNGAGANSLIYPGVSSVINATATFTCAKGPTQTISVKASLMVSESVDADSSAAPIAFDYGKWGEQLLQAC